MEIRTISENEFRDFLHMGEFSFQYELSEEDIKNRKKMLSLENCWALFEDEQMASKLTIHPMEVWLAGKRMPMGGIAGVASWPEYRRKGHIKALMKQSLKVMRQKGQYISMLHPFSFAFYRKYGWELTHTVKKYEIKPEQLPKRDAKIKGKIKRITHDIDRINQIYERCAQQYSGMLNRTEEWWNQSILHNKRDIVAIYQDKNGVDQGYLIYKVKKDHMEIEEWVNMTTEAKRAMLSYVANHDSMIDKITLNPPVEEKFEFLMTDPKIKQEVSSYFMSRIVDVYEFLKAYPFIKDQETQPLIIQVTDSFADWNEGTYIVRINAEGENDVEHFPPKVGAVCLHEPKRGILCDINCLTTLFFNYMSPEELADQGCVRGNAQELKRLESVLQKHKPFLYDFF